MFYGLSNSLRGPKIVRPIVCIDIILFTQNKGR